MLELPRDKFFETLFEAGYGSKTRLEEVVISFEVCYIYDALANFRILTDYKI